MRPTPLPICINVSCVSVTAELLLSESRNKRGEQKYESGESPLWQCEESLPTPRGVALRGASLIQASTDGKHLDNRGYARRQPSTTRGWSENSKDRAGKTAAATAAVWSQPFGLCRWDRVSIATATAAAVWSQPFGPFRRVRPYGP